MSENDKMTPPSGGAITQSPSLADQVAENERARDEEVARRDAARHAETQRDGGPATGTTVALDRYNPQPVALRSPLEARASEDRLAYLQRAPTPPGVTKMRYLCIACGWDSTLSFDPSDPEDAKILEEIGGDIANFSGPCPAAGCGFQTLTPYDSHFHETLNEEASRMKREEAAVITNGVLDTLMERGGDVLLGGAAAAVAEAHGEEEEDPAGELPPLGS
jgi:hypothetical protein